MNAKNAMKPAHPGEILREELDALGLSANALSKALGVPVNRITTILNGRRGVSADTALRLARYFGTTPEFWMNLQKTWELRRAEIAQGRRIAERVKPRQTAGGRQLFLIGVVEKVPFFGVEGTPPFGWKSNPPYPPLSGGYKKAMRHAEWGC